MPQLVLGGELDHLHAPLRRKGNDVVTAARRVLGYQKKMRCTSRHRQSGCVGSESENSAALCREQKSLQTSLELFRQEHIEGARGRLDEMSDREKLLLVRGMTDRVAEALEGAGYRSVDQIAAEGDIDRLAIKTGLDQKRAAMIRDGVAEFMERESKV